MSDYHIKRTKEILKQIIYATVATASKNGKPWNSPVAHFFDSDLNIYWFSDKQSVHSRNIRENQEIFIVIYDSTMEEGTGEAVYIEADAYEVNDSKEVERIAGLQTGNMARSPGDCLGAAPHRFYMAVPRRIWMNGDEKDEEGNWVKDIRVEVPLGELTKSPRQFS